MFGNRWLHFSFENGSNPYIYFGTEPEKELEKWSKHWRIFRDYRYNDPDFYILSERYQMPKIGGHTYKQRQENLRTIAILWQNYEPEKDCSYMDLWDIQEYFETNGKKYGLLKEFKENGII